VDRSTLAGKRDAALVLLGFATAARVSELVAIDITDLRATDDRLDTSLYRRKVKLFTDTARSALSTRTWPPWRRPGAPRTPCSSRWTGTVGWRRR
jgi:integrase